MVHGSITREDKGVAGRGAGAGVGAPGWTGDGYGKEEAAVAEAASGDAAGVP